MPIFNHKNQNFRQRNHFVIQAIAIVLVAIACATFGKTAWATLSFVKSQDTFHTIGNGVNASIPSEFSEKSKSRAPEPSTIALFGSGLVGMIIRFVRKSYATVKRILDIVISIIALILLSPLYLFAALLILIASPGPIFFKQIRVGKDGNNFEILKFRTMKVDAEKATGPVWAKLNDNRLIPCGKFLRKAHIDEIPQFINVLRGEMSVVGPRPERPVFVEQFKQVISDYDKRILVKPGITGLAQVWHKYDESIEDVKKKIKYDLLYIRKICLWTDLTILFRTVRVVFTGEGAR